MSKQNTTSQWWHPFSPTSCILLEAKSCAVLSEVSLVYALSSFLPLPRVYSHNAASMNGWTENWKIPTVASVVLLFLLNDSSWLVRLEFTSQWHNSTQNVDGALFWRPLNYKQSSNAWYLKPWTIWSHITLLELLPLLPLTYSVSQPNWTICSKWAMESPDSVLLSWNFFFPSFVFWNISVLCICSSRATPSVFSS